MKKVLIAEDDKFIANAYRVKLTKASYEVKLVSDGEEFLAELPKFMPDLVILDLVMPKKDGFAALSEMRKDAKYAKLPVIVASNLGQKEDVDKAKRLGASDYVVKSDLSMSELIKKIVTLIGSSV